MSKTEDNSSRQPRVIKLSADTSAPKNSAAQKAPEKVKSKKQSSQASAARKPRTLTKKAKLTPVPDEAAQRFTAHEKQDLQLAKDLTPPPPEPIKKRFRWSRLFFIALGALLSLALGLWVDQLIRDLFARQDWLGWLAVGLTALLVLAALAVIIRELNGLRRLAKIGKIREQAEEALQANDMKSAKSVIDQLTALYSARPDTARGRDALSQHASEIIDGKDLIAIAERDLLKPLDEKARRLVMGSAKRVSVVTAVSPRAIVDIGYVLVENTRLIRQLAELYGGRPGSLGFWRLARNVVGHLAVTGTIAVGEGLVQQLVGQGLAAKISSRLGEGVVNGLLTARIGIAAIDVCRPLSFTDQSRPSVSDFMGELTRFSNASDDK